MILKSQVIISSSRAMLFNRNKMSYIINIIERFVWLPGDFGSHFLHYQAALICIYLQLQGVYVFV